MHVQVQSTDYREEHAQRWNHTKTWWTLTWCVINRSSDAPFAGTAPQEGLPSAGHRHRNVGATLATEDSNPMDSLMESVQTNAQQVLPKVANTHQAVQGNGVQGQVSSVQISHPTVQKPPYIPISKDPFLPEQGQNMLIKINSDVALSGQTIPVQRTTFPGTNTLMTDTGSTRNARIRINDALSKLDDIIVNNRPVQKSANPGNGLNSPNNQPNMQINTNPGHTSGTPSAQVSNNADACKLRACDSTNSCPGKNEYCFFEPTCAIKTCQTL